MPFIFYHPNNRLGLSIAEIGDAIFFYRFGRAPSHAAVLKQYEMMLVDFMVTLELIYQAGDERMDLSLRMIVQYGTLTQFRINKYKKFYGEVVLEARLLLKNEINSHSYVLMGRNQSQIADCSHLLVFTSWNSYSFEIMSKVLREFYYRKRITCQFNE